MVQNERGVSGLGSGAGLQLLAENATSGSRAGARFGRVYGMLISYALLACIAAENGKGAPLAFSDIPQRLHMALQA